MNTNTTLKQQLKIHQDNELHKAKIEERLNNLLNYDKFADYIKEALSLGLSACYNDEDFFATLEPCKSSNAGTFDTYEFNIFCTKDQVEKDKESYKFHAFISVQSKKFNVEILTFLDDDISESDILNCLIKLVGFEFRTNSATLVELLEQESIEKEARKTFISELSNLINTEEIKKILVEAVKSNKYLVASTILDGYNIILENKGTGCFLFYIAELGNNDFKQEILSTSVSIVSIQFTLIQNKNTKNVENGDDELCNFVLKDNLTEWFHYIPEKINRNKVLDYLKKVVGTM